MKVVSITIHVIMSLYDSIAHNIIYYIVLDSDLFRNYLLTIPQFSGRH